MLNFTLKTDGKNYESDDPEKLSQRDPRRGRGAGAAGDQGD